MQKQSSSTSSTEAYRSFADRQVGPQKVGGIYSCGFWKDTYEVVAIDTEEPWSITVRTLGEERMRTHSTGWDEKHDRVLAEPGWPALVFWVEHVLERENTARALLEQRHVLDEVAHPDTVAALWRLAENARYPGGE